MKDRSASMMKCAVVVASVCGFAANGDAAAPAVQKIERYCAASWRNAGIRETDWPDCTQETFARLLDRIDADHLHEAISRSGSEHRRELNRCIWCTVQQWRRSRKNWHTNPDVVDSAAAPQSNDSVGHVLEAVADDNVGLSVRQREILLQYADGSSVGEIAQTLNVSASRVSDEKYKAIQKLRRHFDV